MNLHGCYKDNNITVKYIDNISIFTKRTSAIIITTHPWKMFPTIYKYDSVRTVNRVVVDYSYLLCCSTLSFLSLFELVLLASADLSSYCHCTDSA